MPGAERFDVIQHDAFSLLADCEDESFDLVITDIAYESLELHRSHGTTTRLQEWFKIFPDEDIPRLLAEFYRVLKPGRLLFFMADEWTTDVVKSQQGVDGNSDRLPDGSRRCDNNFLYWKNVIWAKTTLDGAKVRRGGGYHFPAATERIMYFEKRRGKAKNQLDTKARPDCFFIPDVIPAPRGNGGGYPTEKPVELGLTLIDAALKNVEGPCRVLDPFCGSSPFGEAAIRLGHSFLGGDINEKAVTISTERLTNIPDLDMLGHDEE